MQSLKREMEIDLGIIKNRPRKTIGVYDKGLLTNHIPRPTGNIVVPGVPNSDTISILVKTAPDSSQYDLRNGITINQQYPEGPTITIPYLASPGVFVKKMFFLNTQLNENIQYTQGTGILTYAGGGTFADGDRITFEYVYS